MQHQSQIAASVLLIEDDQDSADIFCVALRHEGFGVRSVSSRDEALAVIESCRCDYIIMDLFMPGMGPEDFIDDVNVRSPQSEIILITGSDDIQERAQSLGIRHCIRKPFDYDALFEILR